MSRRHRRGVRSFPPVAFDAAALMAHVPYVRAILRAMGAPSQDEEDIMQEVTAGAWAAMTAGRYRPNPATDPRAALRAWLAEIARRQLGKHRQRAYVRGREVLCDDAYLDLEISVPATLHVPAPDGRYAAQEILEALAAIPLDQRIAVVLHHLEGWTFVEIADLVGVPPGTAAARVRHGIRRFLRAVIRWRRPRS